MSIDISLSIQTTNVPPIHFERRVPQAEDHAGCTSCVALRAIVSACALTSGTALLIMTSTTNDKDRIITYGISGLVLVLGGLWNSISACTAYRRETPVGRWCDLNS